MKGKKGLFIATPQGSAKPTFLLTIGFYNQPLADDF